MAERRDPPKAWKVLHTAYWPSNPVDARAEPNDELLPTEPDWYADSQSAAAAYGAAVTHVISRPDGIRARAQVSATISAAAAAALAGFGSFSDLGERSGWLRALVALAIVAWLWSLRRYIQAIAWSGTRGSAERAETDTDRDYLLKDFARYAREIRFAVRRGTAATQVAIVLTLIGAAALTLDSLLTDPPLMTATLDPKAAAATEAVCGAALGDTVKARIRPADLSRSVVPLQLDRKVCGKTGATLHLPRAWLLAVRDPS